jgi:hypothetical protein
MRVEQIIDAIATGALVLLAVTAVYLVWFHGCRA